MVFIIRPLNPIMNRHINKSVTAILEQIHEVLAALDDAHYTERLAVLSGASLGEHVRHIVEFFEELEAGCLTGVVDYDARKRQKDLETSRAYAMLKLQQIAAGIRPHGKALNLACKMPLNGARYLVATSYERELLYNLEHAVHHMALMKIGVEAMTDISLPAHFGVARSTIEYRQTQCAQ